MFRLSRMAVLMTAVVASDILLADSVVKMDGNLSREARAWNRFADQVFALHKKQVAGRDITIRERTGGYFRYPNFYKEQLFLDKNSGKKISLIQWETANPKNIHLIQVFLYDQQGRPTRDFAAVYRTDDHADPMATEINLHYHTNGLHAFRQFNASDEITYEHCTGTWRQKPVRIRLGIVDLEEMRGEPDTVMTGPQYKACFGRIPVTAGKYRVPQ